MEKKITQKQIDNLFSKRNHTSEKYLEAKLVKGIKAAGGKTIKLKFAGEQSLPDRLVCYPGGLSIFVEVKSTGVKPTTAQLLCHEELRNLGYNVLVVDMEYQVDNLIEHCKRAAHGTPDDL